MAGNMRSSTSIMQRDEGSGKVPGCRKGVARLVLWQC